MSLNALSPGFAVPDFNFASPGFGSQPVLQDEPTERNVAEDAHAAGMFAIAAISQQSAPPAIADLDLSNPFLAAQPVAQPPQAVGEDPVAPALPDLNLFGPMFAGQPPQQAVDASQQEMLQLRGELEVERRRVDDLQARLQEATNVTERLLGRINVIEQLCILNAHTTNAMFYQPMGMAPWGFRPQPINFGQGVFQAPAAGFAAAPVLPPVPPYAAPLNAAGAPVAPVAIAEQGPSHPDSRNSSPVRNVFSGSNTVAQAQAADSPSQGSSESQSVAPPYPQPLVMAKRLRTWHAYTGQREGAAPLPHLKRLQRDAQTKSKSSE